MAIKLYGPILSSCTARVVATLHEKGVTDYELVNVDMMGGAHKQPEYLALQPFGLVPVMVDGPLTLFESRAICRFVAHKFEGQGTPLYGSTPTDSALVEQWMEVEGQNFNPAVSGIMEEKFRKKMLGLEADMAVVLSFAEKLGKVLDIYNAHLSKNKYLAGEFFSLADVSHLPSLNMTNYDDALKSVVEARPHVKRWMEDISSRPTWKKVSTMVRDMFLDMFQASLCK